MYLHSKFRFHSDDGSTRKGFQIKYNALELMTECGGNFANSSGVLTSPFYPNEYQELEDCVYLISQPNGTLININFTYMDINCHGLPSDYIEVRDGDSENSPQMVKFCGNGSSVPESMQTTQNHLRIRLDIQI